MKEWSTIRVPKEVKQRIDYIREKTGKVTWEVINDAVSFYEVIIKNPKRKQEMSNIEKVAWYITKMATAFGAFKENPTEENYQYIIKRVEEIKQRFGVDASIIARIADYYRSIKDEEVRKKIRIDMNMAFKQVIKDIIITAFFEMTTKEQ